MPRGRTGLTPASRETTKAPRSVVVIAVACAIGATTWSSYTHSLFLYGDARAHLNVARHVVDGLRPGLSQLGSVWLPIPHLSMVPLVAIRPLWRNGMAGAIVGGLCFTYASVRIFTLVRELSGNDTAAWWAFLLFAANLNMLYVQSTALTEPVLIAFLVGATYHLVCWMRSYSVRSLTYAAVLTFFATLTRYEGWAFLITGVLVVILWGIHADRRRKSTEANAVLYSVVGGYGIILWLLYNLTIFGDAFYFLHSRYSALSINGGQAKFGLLGTRGNITESTLTYGWAAITVVGPALAVAAAFSTLIIAILPHPSRRRSLFALALLLAPAAFEIVSLFEGQTTIRVPQRAPYEMWNDRYGLLFLPFCAVAVGLLVGRRRWLGKAAALAGIAAVVAMAFTTPLTLADGRVGTSSATAGRPEPAAAYLHAHYRGGRILADDSSVSAFMFAVGLDLKEFVSPGFHPFWEQSLRSPGTTVRWVVASPGDTVKWTMTECPSLFRAFKPVAHEGLITLFKRITPRQTAVKGHSRRRLPTSAACRG